MEGLSSKNPKSRLMSADGYFSRQPAAVVFFLVVVAS
jgi:hypothetical protein